jgi:uncharacterized protein YndB with AHSA1/START domain
MSTDRIEKKTLLRAPRQRIWMALTDSQQFGSWFGMKFGGPFEPGQRIDGVITATTVDAEVAAQQKPYEGKVFEIQIEKMEPQRLFSFRWHPYAVESGYDYSTEPTTLIEFVLEEADGGILLTVTESGFDQIPLARRAKAFAANSGGWEAQLKLIEKYLATQ